MQRNTHYERGRIHQFRNFAIVESFKIAQHEHLSGRRTKPGYGCANEIFQFTIFMTRFGRATRNQLLEMALVSMDLYGSLGLGAGVCDLSRRAMARMGLICRDALSSTITSPPLLPSLGPRRISQNSLKENAATRD